ncbi:MAG: radical SAM protein [Caldiserica bacterium]|nr:radical SAM protein [Caldisericota bacterium]
MRVTGIEAKTILTPSKIPGVDYSLNPYVGCAHGCRYCYVARMPHIRARGLPWGTFVEAKVNAPELLRRELPRARPGTLVIGVSTDPYQPPERELGLTRGILEALADSGARGRFEIRVLTKSPLVLRDTELLRELDAEVGITVTTDSEEVRGILEPGAPGIRERVEALWELKRRGLRTYAFVGPMLPMDPERLVGMLAGAVDRVILDRMNYPWRVRDLYHARGWDHALEEAFFVDLARELIELFAREGTPAEPTRRWAARLSRHLPRF